MSQDMHTVRTLPKDFDIIHKTDMARAFDRECRAFQLPEFNP